LQISYTLSVVIFLVLKHTESREYSGRIRPPIPTESGH
jgi:hypothetical protein